MSGENLSGPRRRPWRTWTALGVVVAVVAGAGTAALLLVGGPAPVAAAPAQTPGAQTSGAQATAAVERRDLQQTVEAQGTLGYADSREVMNGLSGVVTAVADVGSVVHTGEPLYWVDHTPVTLMEGSVPAWRTLQPGVADGPDIAQLERSLVSLGFASEPELTVDEEWTWRTTQAVRDWQESLGLPETGVVELGRVVFLPGARRVASAALAVGGAAVPGQTAVVTTSQTRSITVDLDARRQHAVEEGMTVSVEMPDGTAADATVERVGRVATPGATEGDRPTVEVTLGLVDPGSAGSLDGATVTVTIPVSTAEQVLAVPVTALVAEVSGGFVVDVVSGDGTTRSVPVAVGVFADGWVEVSGDLAEGDLVAVPS